MLGFGHQTVFGLCVGLFAMVAVAVVCIALLVLERQDTSRLQQHVIALSEENNERRLRLDAYIEGTAAQPAVRVPAIK